MTDAAHLVVSELVTNGLRAALALGGCEREGHESGGRTAGGCAGVGRYVCVALYPWRAGIVVDVWDPSPEPPKLLDPAWDEVGGRGLHLVNAVAACWGYRWVKPGGKVVWARLAEGSGW
ncbi:hypothetical protein GCM10023259_069950 [Thermocatellispora tengchongensis]